MGARASMSKLSFASHLGKGAISACTWSAVRVSFQANMIYTNTGKAAEKRPPLNMYAFPASSGKWALRYAPGYGFTDATSNAILRPAAICHCGSVGEVG